MDPNFETLLNKYISEASYIGSALEFEGNIFVISKPQVQFLGKPIGQIAITTHEDKTIRGISLFFPEIVDKSFYELISDEYGTISNIMIVDEIIRDEPLEKKDYGTFTFGIKETIVSLKKGSIASDEVDNVLWDKKDFKIQLKFVHGDKSTEVHFFEQMPN